MFIGGVYIGVIGPGCFCAHAVAKPHEKERNDGRYLLASAFSPALVLGKETEEGERNYKKLSFESRRLLLWSMSDKR